MDPAISTQRQTNVIGQHTAPTSGAGRGTPYSALGLSPPIKYTSRSRATLDSIAHVGLEVSISSSSSPTSGIRSAKSGKALVSYGLPKARFLEVADPCYPAYEGNVGAISPCAPIKDLRQGDYLRAAFGSLRHRRTSCFEVHTFILYDNSAHDFTSSAAGGEWRSCGSTTYISDEDLTHPKPKTTTACCF